MRSSRCCSQRPKLVRDAPGVAERAFAQGGLGDYSGGSAFPCAYAFGRAPPRHEPVRSVLTPARRVLPIGHSMRGAPDGGGGRCRAEVTGTRRRASPAEFTSRTACALGRAFLIMAAVSEGEVLSSARGAISANGLSISDTVRPAEGTSPSRLSRRGVRISATLMVHVGRLAHLRSNQAVVVRSTGLASSHLRGLSSPQYLYHL